MLGHTLLQWTGPSMRPNNPTPPDADLVHQAESSGLMTEMTKSYSDFLTQSRPVVPNELRSQSATTFVGSWSMWTHERGVTTLRVLLEGGTGDMVTSTLDLENCGTTAIYYSWIVCYTYSCRLEFVQ